MKIISTLISNLLEKYSLKDAEKKAKKHLPLIKKVGKKYIKGMKSGDLSYRYPTYIFLFIMLALTFVEFFPDIIRIVTGGLTVVTSTVVAVFRK